MGPAGTAGNSIQAEANGDSTAAGIDSEGNPAKDSGCRILGCPPGQAAREWDSRGEYWPLQLAVASLSTKCLIWFNTQPLGHVVPLYMLEPCL